MLITKNRNIEETTFAEANATTTELNSLKSVSISRIQCSGNIICMYKELTMTV